MTDTNEYKPEGAEDQGEDLPILDIAQWLPGKERFSRVFEWKGERFVLYSVPKEAQGSKPFITDWSIKHWSASASKPEVHEFKLDGYENVEDFLAKENVLLTSLFKRAQETQAKEIQPADIEHDDEVELARYLQRKEMQGVIYDEGEFWRYIGTHWEAIPPHDLSQMVQKLSGLTCGENRAKVRISKTRSAGILGFLADNLTQRDFFAHATQGINAANCFITFREDGTPVAREHSEEHRQRHTLPARWTPEMQAVPPEGSLLSTLLSGTVRDDPQAEAKTWFLQQLMFVTAAGLGTRLLKPKAVTMLGRSAENGKNQILDMAAGLLPKNAVSAVPPDKFGDDNKLLNLVGVKLNISGELSASAIAGETFKGIVTGDLVSGRKAYAGSVTTFRPQAQHIFSANQLPPFKGGFDRGVKRRLAVLEFNRVIPMEERIDRIGHRIATEEADFLLAWALGAAQHILTKKMFEEPPCSKAQVEEWTQTDPVNAWLEDRLLPPEDLDELGEPAVQQKAPCADLFHDFRCYRQAEEGKEPSLSSRAFVDRVKASGRGRYVNSNGSRGFVGLRLAEPTERMKRTRAYIDGLPIGSVGRMGIH
jgi:phage/plasmid-associated DNA primase